MTSSCLSCADLTAALTFVQEERNAALQTAGELADTCARRELTIDKMVRWRADVTTALQRPGGTLFEDVPAHIRAMVQEIAQLRAERADLLSLLNEVALDEARSAASARTTAQQEIARLTADRDRYKAKVDELIECASIMCPYEKRMREAEADRRALTVARIAGNIASGLVGREDRRCSPMATTSELAEWIESITLLSVGLARAIVAATKRTEPQATRETPP